MDIQQQVPFTEYAYDSRELLNLWRSESVLLGSFLTSAGRSIVSTTTLSFTRLMHMAGIRGNALSWHESYLKNREQFVALQGKNDDLVQLVQQESALKLVFLRDWFWGPFFLFCTLMICLTAWDLLRDCFPTFYADDTSI